MGQRRRENKANNIANRFMQFSLLLLALTGFDFTPAEDASFWADGREGLSPSQFVMDPPTQRFQIAIPARREVVPTTAGRPLCRARFELPARSFFPPFAGGVPTDLFTAIRISF